MPIPRVLIGVSILVAGLFMPAIGNEPAPPPAGAIGMNHEYFTTDTVAVRRGQAVTLVNNSHWIHIVGPGRDGRLEEPKGEPLGFRRLMETNDLFTTGTWDRPGIFYLTCSVHPEMNLKVVVGDCNGCCSKGYGGGC